MQIEIRADTGPVLDRLAALGTGAPRALSRALNRTAGAGVTVTVRALAADTGMPQKDIRPKIYSTHATFDNQVARFGASIRPIPLIKLGARQAGLGVTWRTPGGSGGDIPHAFITMMPRSGHRGVFLRRSRKRLPIGEQTGPSLAQLLAKPALVGVVTQRVLEAMPANLDHEVSFLAKQLGLVTAA